MDCQVCNKNAATVHVTEIAYFPGQAQLSKKTVGDLPEFSEQHLCDVCAKRSDVPISTVAPKTGMAILTMLKESAKRARAENAISCPDCGMTLAEFRSKGRLGCPRDYEVFRPHVEPLLLRIHNATKHTGRVPGVDESERVKREQLTDLREKLQEAIRSEAYESAARLRDEIEGLEAPAEPAGDAQGERSSGAPTESRDSAG